MTGVQPALVITFEEVMTSTWATFDAVITMELFLIKESEPFEHLTAFLHEHGHIMDALMAPVSTRYFRKSLVGLETWNMLT